MARLNTYQEESRLDCYNSVGLTTCMAAAYILENLPETHQAYEHDA